MASHGLPAFPWRRRIRQGTCMYCEYKIYKIISYPWVHSFSRSKFCAPRTSIRYKAKPIKQENTSMRYMLLAKNDHQKWYIAEQSNNLKELQLVQYQLIRKNPVFTSVFIDMNQKFELTMER